MLDTSHDFGRPMSAVLTVPDGPAPGPDKWTLLSDLTRAARALGLSHRTLSVLKALLTFLPGREISPRPGPSIVFPANRTLSERLNGMPESTLRRHLAALVSAGIVSRRDSPNRKRFARRVGGAGGIAFGFDLAPLAQRAGEIAEHARQARQAEEEHAVLRARLGDLRARLLPDDADLSDTVRKALRRKDNHAELRALIDRLGAAQTEETGVSDSETERHIQDADEKDSDSRKADRPGPGHARLPPVPRILAACPSHRAFYPDSPQDWRGLMDVAEKMAPMIGIERAVLHDAQRSMGAEGAAVTVLCLVERISEIGNPGGYLRRLTQLARTGAYRADSALNALLNRSGPEKLSADNSRNGYPAKAW